MCGITGIYAFNEIGRIHMINMANATAAIASRGPDNQSFFHDHFVGLGHRRLSILDTSPAAHQPMTNRSGRYTIIFNGEIFNFKAIRQELESKGLNFTTSGDTEVLLQLFIHEKEKCLEKLNGFFAFAVYDKSEKTLFVARDRMGIKPLVYFQDEDKFLFASEMKSLFAYGINKSIDKEALSLYLQLNYTPAPNTMLTQVKKLKPGHYMWLDSQGNREIKSYYKIPYTANQTVSLSYKEQQKVLTEKLEEAVQKRLIADVPLGTFLSGGIDSSVITALASRHVDKLHTFSIGFKNEPFFDETSYAQLVAKKFNTEHTVFSLGMDDIFEHLHDVLHYLDEPFADSSALNVYVLSKETRRRVTVALSGDGADELFGGYNKHMAYFRSLHGGTPANMLKQLLPLWRALPKSRNNPFSNRVRQFQRFAEGANLPPAERYWYWASFCQQDAANQLLTADYQYNGDSPTKNELLSHMTSDSGLNASLYSDCKLVLPYDMLAKVDLMSMANSLEVRVPFLDHNVVNFAFGLPESSKVNKQMKKRILQDAFRDILPPQLYKRPKHGFEVPLLRWFRTDLKRMIEKDLLCQEFVEDQGVFNYTEVKRLKQELFSSNPGDSHARIWGLLVFQTWWKKYLSV